MDKSKKRFTKNSLVVIWIALFVFVTLYFPGSKVVHAATVVDLGAADPFAVLAGAAVTNVPTSDITGDLGLSPAAGSFYDGGVTQAQVTGTIYSTVAGGPAGEVVNPTLLTAAKQALTDAYTDAANQTTDTVLEASTTDSFTATGYTLTPGVYTSPSALGVTGTLTLNGGADDVWVFQAGSSLTTASDTVIALTGGASACNVFWQIGSSTGQFGTNTIFKGTVMSDASITDAGGLNLEGRLMAFTGTVALNNTTITVPVCVATTPTPTPAPPSPHPATFNVVKTVINDSGRTKVVADFPLFVNGTPVVSGETNTFPAPGPVFTVTETEDPNYTLTFSGDCDANGQFNLNPGDNKFCIVTNDDIGPSAAVVPPVINVVKVPSPLFLPAGPSPVTYTYTLTNLGTVPVTDITMVGDTCSPVVRVSGDVNDDNKLDVSETWKYTCSTMLSETHTNNITATGWANGISAVDVASATVIVGAPIEPPLINVTKVPSPLALFAGGGTVTYTKKVTNPGTVALSNVYLTDNKCSPLQYISGDTDSDLKLDVTETWTYTCQMNLTQTTVNTVLARGEANGLVARDFAIATVVVAAVSPVLPSTGVAPQNVLTWNIIMAGILVILVFLFLTRRRQNNSI